MAGRRRTSPPARRRTRLAAASLAAGLVASPAHSAGVGAPDTRLEAVVVNGKKRDTVGEAVSASAGVVGGVELSQRPLARTGEVLEGVPGLIVTAHTSGGKANQYYLRGFNLDHGTDFASFIDGVPVNLGTHAHGQGYMDLNGLLPELISAITYRKGPYYADVGDFAAAGSANIDYVSRLPRPFLLFEGGTDGYRRALLAGSTRAGPGTLLFGVEDAAYDGPFRVAARYDPRRALLRYTEGDETRGGSASLQLYAASWFGSDQIPKAAVDAGLPGGRFGSLDPTDGGRTGCYSVSGERHWVAGAGAYSFRLYAVRYGLDLFSNFSGFIDQVDGDQIRQHDDRLVVGGAISAAYAGRFLGAPTTDTFGLQSRNDIIGTELDHTRARHTLALLRQDRALIDSVGLWWADSVSWSARFRTTLGLRVDVYHFALDSNTPANAGEITLGRPEPKVGVVYTPVRTVDIYAQAGISERSNDARGVFDRASAYPDGPTPTQSTRPLVRSMGAEAGLRLRAGPRPDRHCGGLVAEKRFRAVLLRRYGIQ